MAVHINFKGDKIMENGNHKNSEFYCCKRLRMLEYLLDEGFRPVKSLPDADNYRYKVWLFDNTPELQETVSIYFDMLKHKNDDKNLKVKKFVVYSRRKAFKMRDLGYKILETGVNAKNPLFNTYIFEDTEDFRRDFSELKDS